MPIAFQTDAQTQPYGRFAGNPVDALLGGARKAAVELPHQHRVHLAAAHCLPETFQGRPVGYRSHSCGR